MFWDAIVLSSLLCLFLVYIGVKSSQILYLTGVKLKWPLFLTIWVICITYLADQLLEMMIYYKHNLTDSEFNNLFDSRSISITLHETVIYIAMWLVVFHTQSLNRKTIRLLSLLELKKID